MECPIVDVVLMALSIFYSATISQCLDRDLPCPFFVCGGCFSSSSDFWFVHKVLD